MQESSQNTPRFSKDAVQTMLAELRRMPEAFATLFASESEETLHHRSPGEWSAVEMVAHLAEHDAFERAQRFEAILSEENPTLPDDDTRFEVARSDFQSLSSAEALDDFRRERGLTLALLKRLGPGDWMRTGMHPNDSERTLFQLADLRGHDQEHFEQARVAIASAKR